MDLDNLLYSVEDNPFSSYIKFSCISQTADV